MTEVPADASGIEAADIAVADAATSLRDLPPVRLLGALSEVGDQPPMIVISVGTWAAGWLRGDARLAGAGVRMLAAHFVATQAKSFIKARVDRTRPFVLADGGEYQTGTQGIDAPEHNSFPSGHTAGAVAVARAFGRTYPEHATKASLAATAIAVMQIPRCKHYPSDVGVGAIIGLVSEWLVSRVLPPVRARPTLENAAR